MTEIVLFGIKNCDTVKKAKQWLDEHKITTRFHDFRENGLDETLLSVMGGQLGAANMVNKRSTTWRQLDEETKLALTDETAFQLMLNNPTLIKRPVLEFNGHFYQGFSTKLYGEIFT